MTFISNNWPILLIVVALLLALAMAYTNRKELKELSDRSTRVMAEDEAEYQRIIGGK